MDTMCTSVEDVVWLLLLTSHIREYHRSLLKRISRRSLFFTMDLPIDALSPSPDQFSSSTPFPNPRLLDS